MVHAVTGKKEGVKGFVRRYLDTRNYINEYKDSDGDPRELERLYRRDRNIVRYTTMPLATLAAFASYFTPSSQEWTKVGGHVAKGYVASILGQMAAEKRLKGLGKYGTGLGTSAAAGAGWEGAQEAGLLSGNFGMDDIGYDMIGGLAGAGLENFFDRKMGKVSRLYENE
jgi:hypothetical protein